jgi:hypothetical protein
MSLRLAQHVIVVTPMTTVTRGVPDVRGDYRAVVSMKGRFSR